MPRTNRHFLPGHIWHITHRCHQRAFLLKFTRDRRRCLRRLFEAKKRFGFCVLEEALTCGMAAQDERWSEAVAVGSLPFADKVKTALGMRAMHRGVSDAGGTHPLRKPRGDYTRSFGRESGALRPNNAVLREENLEGAET